jgi:hypothetical protein
MENQQLGPYYSCVFGFCQMGYRGSSEVVWR